MGGRGDFWLSHTLTLLMHVTLKSHQLLLVKQEICLLSNTPTRQSLCGSGGKKNKHKPLVTEGVLLWLPVPAFGDQRFALACMISFQNNLLSLLLFLM